MTCALFSVGTEYPVIIRCEKIPFPFAMRPLAARTLRDQSISSRLLPARCAAGRILPREGESWMNAAAAVSVMRIRHDGGVRLLIRGGTWSLGRSSRSWRSVTAGR